MPGTNITPNTGSSSRPWNSPSIRNFEAFITAENARFTPGDVTMPRITTRAKKKTLESIDIDVTQSFDTGNIRAICYSINNGATPVIMAQLLEELGATFEELEGVIKLYRDHYQTLSSSRFDEIKKIFKDYAEKSQLPAKKTPCFNCKKEFIYWNLSTIYAKPIDKEKSTEVNVCSGCMKKLSKSVSKCEKHHGSILLGNPRAICPLYPKKCKPQNYCTSPECLNRHMEMAHKGYLARRWKHSKKLLSSQEGKIIKSDLMTGVEYEVIGKNKQTFRTNIFKLGKKIGIDHDSSLHDDSGEPYYLATELVTPPASGKKLEELVERASAALIKDGFIVNERCGLHIHIDLFKKFGHINLNPNFYKSLLVGYVFFESVFYDLAPISRQNNANVHNLWDKYANKLVNEPWFISTKFSKIWYGTDNDAKVIESRNMKRHPSKYYWVNFHSLLRKEGLEIRLLEGTMDSRTILMWTRLHHEFIKKISENKNYYKQFGALYSAFGTNREKKKKVFIEFLNPDKELLAFIKEREKMNTLSVRGNSISDEDIVRIISSTLR